MDTALHVQGISLNEPAPYQPTRAYTEFIQVEVSEDDDDTAGLPSKVKYSIILQEEEYEEEEEDFFS
jgi:hypothetical protein